MIVNFMHQSDELRRARITGKILFFSTFVKVFVEEMNI